MTTKMTFNSITSIKDIIIDDLKCAMGLDEHSGVVCNLCGFTHSVERLDIETREGTCTLNLCEQCSHTIKKFATFEDHGVKLRGVEKIDA